MQFFPDFSAQFGNNSPWEVVVSHYGVPASFENYGTRWGLRNLLKYLPEEGILYFDPPCITID